MIDRPGEGLPEFAKRDVFGRVGQAVPAAPFEGVLIAVDNVRFGGFGVSAFYQAFFHHVLDFFDRGIAVVVVAFFKHGQDAVGHAFRHAPVASSHGHRRAVDGEHNFIAVEIRDPSVALDDLFNHTIAAPCEIIRPDAVMCPGAQPKIPAAIAAIKGVASPPRIPLYRKRRLPIRRRLS